MPSREGARRHAPEASVSLLAGKPSRMNIARKPGLMENSDIDTRVERCEWSTGREIVVKSVSDSMSVPVGATGVAMTPGLQAETERLLSNRTRDIRLSPEMIRAYREKTWPQRSKIARAWMIWVSALSIIFVPVSYLLVPEFLWYTAIIGWLLIPGLKAVGYLIWRRPRDAFVEGASLVLIINIMMIAFGFLAVAAGGGDYERFLTGMLFVSTIAIVVFSVEHFWSLALMLSSASIFAGFEVFNPAINLRAAIGTTLFYLMGLYAVTIARKTQSILGQKTFLLSLRDQYRSGQLEILATRDPLTGLSNRRSATALIEKLWNDRRIPKSSVAFVMADIDSFKRLNDTAGHGAGDECIQRVARAIEQTMRSDHDAVFRYGGEEFLIVLSNATPDLAWTLAERIRCAVEALAIVNPGIHRADGSTGVVTISLGVAFAREDAAPELVAKWADDALYDAKRSGRNAVFMSTAQIADPRPGEATASSQCNLSVAPANIKKMIA